MLRQSLRKTFLCTGGSPGIQHWNAKESLRTSRSVHDQPAFLVLSTAHKSHVSDGNCIRLCSKQAAWQALEAKSPARWRLPSKRDDQGLQDTLHWKQTPATGTAGPAAKTVLRCGRLLRLQQRDEPGSGCSKPLAHCTCWVELALQHLGRWISALPSKR